MKKILKYKKHLIILLILIVILLMVFNNKKENKRVSDDNIIKTIKTEQTKEIVEEEIKKIKVDIKGSIVNPGVYELDINSRVIDVINLAGGINEAGDTSLINLSKILEDEMVIIIYTKEETNKIKENNKEEIINLDKECICNEASIIPCEKDETLDKEINTKISISTATLEELQTLPGIGEAKANDIIDYRNSTGFKTIEDLMNITGIGVSTYDKIKDLITL